MSGERERLAAIIDAEWTRPEHGCDGTEEGCRSVPCPVPAYGRMGLDQLRDTAADALLAAGVRTAEQVAQIEATHSPGETCEEAEERFADAWQRAEAELAEARARLAAVEAMLAAVAQVRRHYVDLDDISVLAEAVVRRLDAALARPEGAPDAE